MSSFARHTAAMAFACVSICSSALTKCPLDEFYSNLKEAGSSEEVECGTWYGSGERTARCCMRKAKDTGYLMLWFLFSKYGTGEYDCENFRKHAICRDSFVNLVNDYGYLILCASDYAVVVGVKNELYGYVGGGSILDENTGTYVDNKNGYPESSPGRGSLRSDITPSLHLLKFDKGGNILFHVFAECGKYDSDFSPYATRFPIPFGMNVTDDMFAPWFGQYLDMYRAKDQIAGYLYSGGGSHGLALVEMAITETVHPSASQISIHRDNVVFRSVTSLRDLMVKHPIDCTPTNIDSRCMVFGRSGQWFVNHDDTLSAVPNPSDTGVELRIVPSTNCTLSINQRNGTGFDINTYDCIVTTNVVWVNEMLETGTVVENVFTNVVVTASPTASGCRKCERNEYAEYDLEVGKTYSISTKGRTMFDIFSTK